MPWLFTSKVGEDSKTIRATVLLESMTRITWKRRSHAPTPEQEYGDERVLRQEAVESLLQDAGIDPGEYEYVNPPRRLGGATGAFFTVCELVIENPEWAAFAYWYLSQNDDNEVEVDDRIDELADEQLEAKIEELGIEVE